MRRAALIVVLLLCGVPLVVTGSCRRSQGGKQPQVTRVNPVRGRLVETVAASGTIRANLDVEIKCKASGTVVSIPFDIGDEVLKGDLLVMLDPVDEERNIELAGIALQESEARRDRAQASLRSAERNLQTARERARVELEASQARAAQAQADYERVLDLFNRGFASQSEVDQARTQLETANAELDSAKVRFAELDNQEADLELLRQDLNLAEAAVRSAQISLETAYQRLEDTKVYAPIDGVVTARYVQAGQIISSGISATTGGTPVMKLSDLSRIFVVARVDESDIGKVRTGQKVEVSVDAHRNERFGGEVVRIARAGENVQSVVTFEVRIEVTTGNVSLLLPEMSADVKIVISEVENALQIPSRAVFRRDGKCFVNLALDNGQTEQREVVTGLDNGEFVEIISGLSESDVVLLSEGTEESSWSRNRERSPGPPVMMPLGGPR